MTQQEIIGYAWDIFVKNIGLMILVTGLQNVYERPSKCQY